MSALLRRWMAQTFLRGVVRFFVFWEKLGCAVIKAHGHSGDARPKTIVLTGTFYSENWVLNHVRPMAASSRCRHTWLVCSRALPPMPKVTVLQPNPWLQRIIGQTPSRLLTFAWAAIRLRPDFLGGFHFLLNGMLAMALAPWIRSQSLYICGGGFQEIKEGGWKADNRLFDLLSAPDHVLERLLIDAVKRVSVVITMGPSASRDFQSRGVRTRLEVIPGGIDPAQYATAGEAKEYDLILIGHLIPVKGIDLLLQTVQWLASSRPGISAIVVGTGRLEVELRTLAVNLGVEQRVTFAGYQSDVGPWLKRSRVFILTSLTEGLSLALMEAMMCGLPAVVPNVGELGELVEDGRNGFLVDERRPEAYASRILRLLQNDDEYRAFCEAARTAARRFDLTQATRRWDEVLGASEERLRPSEVCAAESAMWSVEIRESKGS